MMSTGRNNHYSIQDIEKYLEGKMSPAEMHALEAAALDDPFLADAIEGLQSAYKDHGKDSISAQLFDIGSKLRNEAAPKRRTVVDFAWVKIFAAASVIAVLGVLGFYLIPGENAKDELAVAQKIPPQESASQPSRPSLNDTQHQGIQDSPLTSPATHQSRSLAEPGSITSGRKPDHSKKLADETAITRQKPYTDSEKEKNEEAEIAAVSNNDAIGDLLRNQDSVHLNKENSQFPAVHIITGKVLNSNKEPLANASVNLLENRKAITRAAPLFTDNNGNFSIKSQDSLLNVEIISAGYAARNYQLRSSVQSNNIVLEEANVAMEIQKKLVRNRAAKTAASLPSNKAEPITGWLEFEEYINKNKQIDPNSPKGEVIVSFRVNIDGSISNLKVEKSLSEKADSDALRLLREGPSWKLITNGATMMRIIIHYP